MVGQDDVEDGYQSWYKVFLKPGDDSVNDVISRFMRGRNPYGVGSRTLKLTCAVEGNYAYFKFKYVGEIYEKSL
ncbi:MAG: hypothetical protein J4428_02940 [Candidatus Aenigmarchaeota archaeon]|nr:hypothetical protein [Candidatus Aenigmarchaeota archaeon]